MTRTMWLAASALLAAVPLARADDPYTIKLKTAGVGDVVLVERSSTLTTETDVTDAKGKTVSGDKEKDTETYVYRETILAQEAGKQPTKVRREYDKAQLKKGDKTTDLPYAGKRLLIERKKDGKFHVQIEGGAEVTGDDASALDSEFNSSDEVRDFEQHFLPDHAVKAEEDWKLDMAPIVRLIDQSSDVEGDATKARGTGQLAKAYPKDDRQFGHFLVHYAIPLKSAGSGKDKHEALEGSAVTDDVDMDACMDGKVLDGAMRLTTKATILTTTVLKDGTMGKMIVVMKGHLVETDKEQPKK